MHHILILLVLFSSVNALATTRSAATEANQERVTLMTTALGSAEVASTIEAYSLQNFVFDGINWLNTRDSFRYFSLVFKKYDLQTSEKNGEKIFTAITTTCRHKVILKFGKVDGNSPKGCTEQRESISEKELLKK